MVSQTGMNFSKNETQTFGQSPRTGTSPQRTYFSGRALSRILLDEPQPASTASPWPRALPGNGIANGSDATNVSAGSRRRSRFNVGYVRPGPGYPDGGPTPATAADNSAPGEYWGPGPCQRVAAITFSGELARSRDPRAAAAAAAIAFAACQASK